VTLDRFVKIQIVTLGGKKLHLFTSIFTIEFLIRNSNK
jgi:hypothetical protein